MKKRELPLFKDERAAAVLEELCAQHGLDLPLIKKLIDIQRDNLGRGKQIGITQEFSAVLSEFIEQRREIADAAE
jgi:hypothetical protein